MDPEITLHGSFLSGLHFLARLEEAESLAKMGISELGHSVIVPRGFVPFQRC